MIKVKVIHLVTFFTLLLIYVPISSAEQADPKVKNQANELVQNQVDKKEASLSLDQLLLDVKSGRQRDSEENQERLREFRTEKSKQEQLLADLLIEEKRQETISDQGEAQFEENEKTLTDLQRRLDERLGALRELFGVLQQVSGDAEAQLGASVTQLEFPERTQFLDSFTKKMGQTSELPNISEIETLWFELQQEMTATGKISLFQHAVIDPHGKEVEENIVRVGAFNLLANGRYLQFVPETGRVLEYARQPSSRYLAGAEKISSDQHGLIPVMIDPARGQLLSLIVQAPKFSERIAQGGVIGYVIIVLGVVTLVIALIRFVMLAFINSKIKKQKSNRDDIQKTNPLGRILNEYFTNKQCDIETVELKVSEAVLREIPQINRGLSFLKIIAAVAPLMGLLGTVTGMILTFQTITLFGTGDPKLMAGGISQALVTTVLGLSVAIPTLLMHNLLQTKAKDITDVLEQEATALVAKLSRENEQRIQSSA